MGSRVLPFKDISACSIVGIMDESGRRFSGADIIRAIANMHERSNGLGGGFAAYGIYPERPDQYALHCMFETQSARTVTEALLEESVTVCHAEPIPTRPTEGIGGEPILYRYFVTVPDEALTDVPHLTADDIVLVAEGTPIGLVRAAALTAAWVGPKPRLVLNRVPDRIRDDVVGAARRWTGLDPAAAADLRLAR